MLQIKNQNLKLLKSFILAIIICVSAVFLSSNMANAQAANSSNVPQPPAGNPGQTTTEGADLIPRGAAALTANNAEEGRRLLLQACNLNTAIGCYGVATSYNSPRWGPVNKPEAMRYYALGCALGSGISCFEAGSNSEQMQTPTELVKARNFYKLGCDAGNGDSCGNLALFLYHGKGGAKDLVGAGRTAQAACTNNVSLACAIIGEMEKDGIGRPKNLVLARQSYERGCSLRHAFSCDLVAAMYGAGEGGPIDLTRARSFYEKGCNLDEAESCSQFGLMSARGMGGPENEPSARSSFDKACLLGSATSCQNAGILFYTNPAGGAPEKARARDLFAKACAKGIGSGCEYQISMMREGVGGPKDGPGSVAVAERACVNGSPKEICALLGEFVLKGIDTPRNEARGRALLTASCNAGYQEACSVLANYNGVKPK